MGCQNVPCAHFASKNYDYLYNSNAICQGFGRESSLSEVLYPLVGGGGREELQPGMEITKSILLTLNL